MENICGANCEECDMLKKCKGCLETNGHPFGGNCVLAECCGNKKSENSTILINEYKNKLMDEFNSLNIKDMPKVTELYALNGEFINMEYKLPNNMNIKFWNDNDVYLGAQAEKEDGSCYGLVADDNYLLVCEYKENGEEPKIIIFKSRK